VTTLLVVFEAAIWVKSIYMIKLYIKYMRKYRNQRHFT